MSLDLYFYKKDFDIQKNRTDISDCYRKLRAIQDEIERLEDDYEDARLSSLNIINNLNAVAQEAGLHEILWSPDEMTTTASQMIVPLEKGIKELEANPDKYKAFDASDGFRHYKSFADFCKAMLRKCHEYPDAVIEASK
jgi:hypothetical protein